MKTLPCFPHSSTGVESVLKIKQHENKDNSLSTESIVSLLQTKYLLKNSCSSEFKIVDSLLQKRNIYLEVKGNGYS